MDIPKIVHKAKKSPVYLRILNIGLSFMVPFNKPHKFRVVEIGDFHIKIKVPYRKSNFNHIRGIHACALATLSEFSTGFILLTRLDAQRFRIIMQSIHMEYHYQAKMDAYADFHISEDWMQSMVFEPLKTAEKTIVDCEVKIHDKAGNHISTGIVKWQIKPWDRVKTKV